MQAKKQYCLKWLFLKYLSNFWWPNLPIYVTIFFKNKFEYIDKHENEIEKQFINNIYIFFIRNIKMILNSLHMLAYSHRT